VARDRYELLTDRVHLFAILRVQRPSHGTCQFSHVRATESV